MVWAGEINFRVGWLNIAPCIPDMLLYAYTMLTSILRDAVSAGPNFLCILDMFITIFVMVRYDDEICPRWTLGLSGVLVSAGCI